MSNTEFQFSTDHFLFQAQVDLCAPCSLVFSSLGWRGEALSCILTGKPVNLSSTRLRNGSSCWGRRRRGWTRSGGGVTSWPSSSRLPSSTGTRRSWPNSPRPSLIRTSRFRLVNTEQSYHIIRTFLMGSTFSRVTPLLFKGIFKLKNNPNYENSTEIYCKYSTNYKITLLFVNSIGDCRCGYDLCVLLKNQSTSQLNKLVCTALIPIHNYFLNSVP